MNITPQFHPVLLVASLDTTLLDSPMKQAMRDAGLLFISTVATYGQALWELLPAKRTVARENTGGKSKKKRSATPKAAIPDSHDDDDILPVEGERAIVAELPAPVPAALSPPDLRTFVQLADVYSGKNSEWGVGDVKRHLVGALVRVVTVVEESVPVLFLLAFGT